MRLVHTCRMLVRYDASLMGTFPIPRWVVAIRIERLIGRQLWLGGKTIDVGATIPWKGQTYELVCLEEGAMVYVEHLDTVPTDEAMVPVGVVDEAKVPVGVVDEAMVPINADERIPTDDGLDIDVDPVTVLLGRLPTVATGGRPVLSDLIAFQRELH